MSNFNLLGDNPLYRLYNLLKGTDDRPDEDGELTFLEARSWYRKGHGQTLTVNASSIDLSGVSEDGFVKGQQVVNLEIMGNNISQGLVYGSITLKKRPDGSTEIYKDQYNFEQHDTNLEQYNTFEQKYIRNPATFIGNLLHGGGQMFEIKFQGNAILRPKTHLFVK
ncbi:MAG: hypothetical protein H7257_14030 [Taibaiella sp.]|nr:hypothetical protein [Taibaiella sp.]